ncbi:MAG: cobalamin-dependent protein [Coriobacteriales bacterium]|nr:cobalamin-dependent protein [Coriobacteriales bacterium]
MDILESISQHVQKGQIREVSLLVTQALESGIPAQKILDEGLLKGMYVLGVRFRDSEAFIPEVLNATKAYNVGTSLLIGEFVLPDAKPLGRVIIATVEGDMHDIGKTLVKHMLQGAGFEVVDLGVDVSAERIVAGVMENKPDIVALSALLATTMTRIEGILNALTKAGLRKRVKVMIGGAAVSQAYCDEVGADAYSEDATKAVCVAKNLLGF